MLTIPLHLASKPEESKLLSPKASPIKLEYPGSGANVERQEGSHPHQVAADPSGNTLWIPDLGSDTIWKLVRDESTGAWKVGSHEDAIKTERGHGPRHLVVKCMYTANLAYDIDIVLTSFAKPSDGHLYVINELTSTLTEYAHGLKKPTQDNISTLASGKPAKDMLGAEILSAEGLLYASNRNDPDEGGDTIAIFSTPDLRLLREVRTGLNHLRAVALGGVNNEYLIVGGKDGGGIKVYEMTNVDGVPDLKEVAALAHGVVEQPTSFIML